MTALDGTPALSVGVLSIFPELLEHYLDATLLGKARRNGLLEVNCIDLRAGASGVHRSVDDAPFGGGAGMVLAPEPVFAVVERFSPPRPIYLMSPSGRPFDQRFAEELAARGSFSLLAARYEGVDQRITEGICEGEISIGDYVLAGGELAALVVIEAVARLVPGVLGNEASPEDESFSDGLLEYPQYTRPAEFRGEPVPEVLRSGDHARIAAWRRAASLARTMERRPDLIARRGGLSDAEVQLLLAHDYNFQAIDAGQSFDAGVDPVEERDLQ